MELLQTKKVGMVFVLISAFMFSSSLFAVEVEWSGGATISATYANRQYKELPSYTSVYQDDLGYYGDFIPEDGKTAHCLAMPYDSNGAKLAATVTHERFKGVFGLRYGYDDLGDKEDPESRPAVDKAELSYDLDAVVLKYNAVSIEPRWHTSIPLFDEAHGASFDVAILDWGFITISQLLDYEGHREHHAEDYHLTEQRLIPVVSAGLDHTFDFVTVKAGLLYNNNPASKNELLKDTTNSIEPSQYDDIISFLYFVNTSTELKPLGLTIDVAGIYGTNFGSITDEYKFANYTDVTGYGALIELTLMLGKWELSNRTSYATGERKEAEYQIYNFDIETGKYEKQNTTEPVQEYTETEFEYFNLEALYHIDSNFYAGPSVKMVNKERKTGNGEVDMLDKLKTYTQVQVDVIVGYEF